MGYYGAKILHGVAQSTRKPKPETLTSQQIQSMYPRQL